MGRAAAITEIEYEEQQRDIIRVVSARTLELWSLLRACRSGASFCFKGAKLARFCVPGLRQARQLHRLAEIQRWNRLGAGSCDLRVKVRNTARPGIASASVCPAPDKTAGAFGSDPNRGYETMPAVLVMAVLSGLALDAVGLALGAVATAYFEPIPETTPAQQLARASRKWCPPNSSMIQPRAETTAPAPPLSS